MLRSRKISEELKLNMKIGDVEYQAIKPKQYSTILLMRESISGS